MTLSLQIEVRTVVAAGGAGVGISWEGLRELFEEGRDLQHSVFDRGVGYTMCNCQCHCTSSVHFSECKLYLNLARMRKRRRRRKEIRERKVTQDSERVNGGEKYGIKDSSEVWGQ